ncbi:MAG: metal ABC transporter substrate-binding protein [Lachnospiraceae bacterium]|nr:metal ABC transporter substrate-binding protein [Lachnospiraceae bacterium]
MKRLLLLFILILSITFICACEKNDYEDEGKISVVTVNFPPYDFTSVIGGDKVSVTLLVKPGTESHTYEPKPKEMRKIAECDLFIYGGGESDEWVETLLSGEEYRNINTLKMMKLCSLRDEETKEGMTIKKKEDNGDEDEHEYDEHVWTSVLNAKLIVEGICEKLSAVSPENSTFFEENAKAYLNELDKIDSEIREVVKAGNKDTLIFGDRFPFLYFVKEYSLDYFAAIPGCAAETEPSAQTVAFLIDKVKKEKINVILYLELTNAKIAKVISEETGAKIMMFHSCHNLSQDEFERGENYLSLMKKNIEVLKEALE